MARFRMKRIERPRWSDEPDIWLNDMRLADYEAIQKRRRQMLKAVHQEIENYLNTTGLYYEYEDEANESFPNRFQMTGEYYIGYESYTAHVGPVWFQVSIKCHCLGRRTPKKRQADDYLGLEVWLRCDPDKWTFTIFRNTDSSVI